MKPSYFALAGLLAAAVIAVPASAQLDLKKLGSDLLKGTTTPSTTGSSAPGTTALSNPDIISGLKEALRVGADNVVGRLGTSGGFSDDAAVHIPLPASLQQAKSLLARFGTTGLFDDLELRLNRAAEAATPKTKELFVKAIQDMSLDDARAIYEGPKDAATRYFQSKMTPELSAAMRPVVEESLADVGAIQAYDNAMAEYRKLPMVPDVKANLTEYVVEKGLDGIFHYLAQEEAAIRTNPVARTTDLLKRVFGQ
jgi:hypothetical protein